MEVIINIHALSREPQRTSRPPLGDRTHHTIATHTLIVLAEVYLIAHQWLHLLLKLTLAETFEEVTTSIPKQAWLDKEHAL